jgi:hypothetical protein
LERSQRMGPSNLLQPLQPHILSHQSWHVWANQWWIQLAMHIRLWLVSLWGRREALVLAKSHNRSLSLIVTYITQVDDEQLNC